MVEAGVRVATAGRDDLGSVAILFGDYASTLPIDLAFQGFREELATLPGRYAGPGGAIFLARELKSGEALGCIAVRPLPGRAGACEVKRLYVRPAGRGTGTGRALVAAALGFGQAAGYREALLDTLATMEGAIALYRKAGFEPTANYGAEPVDGQLFFRKRLTPE